jgi:hypothetical protein
MRYLSGLLVGFTWLALAPAGRCNRLMQINRGGADWVNLQANMLVN